MIEERDAFLICSYGADLARALPAGPMRSILGMTFELARGVATWMLHAAGAVLEPYALPHLIEGSIGARRVRVTILQKTTLSHVRFLTEDGRLNVFPDCWNIVVFPSNAVPAGAGAAIERLGMVPCDPYGLSDVLKLGDLTPGETPPSPSARRRRRS